MNAMNGHWPECLQEAYELHQTVEQNLEVQLAMCGVIKEEVNTVVLSHMHFDHVGNVHMFTNSEILAPKDDFMFSQTTVRITDDPTQYCGYSKKDLDVVVKKYTLIDGNDDFELVPGVRIINLPGHTPGLLGLIITLDSETWIFPMDAVYTNEIYGPPAKASGLLHDRAQYFSSIEKVRRLAKELNARVIPAHDWDLFQTLKKAPEYYE